MLDDWPNGNYQYPCSAATSNIRRCQELAMTPHPGPEASVNHYIDQLQLIDFRRVISGQNAPSEVVPNVSVRGDRPQNGPAHCVRPPTPEGRSQRRGRLTVTARRRLPAPLKYCGNRSRDALSSHVTFAADESSTPEPSKCTEIFYQKYVSVLVIASILLPLVNNSETRCYSRRNDDVIIPN